MIKLPFDRRLAAVIALSASAAACATAPPPEMADHPVATVADLHKITVEQAGERIELSTGGADGVLSPENMAMVDSFGRMYRDQGHGPLIVSTPTGAGDTNAAARLAQAVRLELADGGVPYAAIAGSTYDATGKTTAPVVLSFTHFTAEAPECAPVWTVDLAKTGDNKTPPTFGCFVNANLAAMIADPADLNGPRDIDPRDGARRSVVMEKYRNGEPTGAIRSDDEHAKISDAIK